MAENKAEAEAAGDEVPPPKKSKKKLLIIVGVLVAAIGGGAAWWFLKGGKPADPKAAEAAKKAELAAKPPLYTQLDKEITTALTRSDAEDHYLQIEIKMKVADEKVAERISQRVPEIRNALILLMSSKSAEDLKSVEDKQRLAAEMAAAINKVISSDKPDINGVQGVFFTSFILQ